MHALELISLCCKDDIMVGRGLLWTILLLCIHVVVVWAEMLFGIDAPVHRIKLWPVMDGLEISEVWRSDPLVDGRHVAGAVTSNSNQTIPTSC